MTEHPSARPSRREREDAALPWHAQSTAAALKALEADERGLSSVEAASRLDRQGPNQLPRVTGPSALELLLEQVKSPLMYALLLAAGVALLLGELEDGLVVIAVVVLNALIGFGQEYRAGRAIAALAELIAEPVRVRRDGAWTEIPSEQVVPGDVVSLAQGDRVPADIRLLASEALRTQEAALTGESAPVAKSDAPAPVSAPAAERSSVVYAGTLVAAGTGHGITFATGANTELGRISSLLEAADPLKTPLTRELDRVGRAITFAIGIAALLLVLAAALRGFPVADAALVGISLAVAAVPEGLPAVVTIALAIGVQRMARRRAIIRHLPAVETLGSTTVIASDKTGTLTRNQLAVQSRWTPAGESEELARATVLCNDAKPTAAGGALGDPVDAALLLGADQAGVDPARERTIHERLETLPFDADRRFMATLHSEPTGGAVLYVKGAPEALLPRCDESQREAARREVERLAGRGERVLLFASRTLVRPGEIATGLEDLRLLGLVGMIDPPRPEAGDAVAACQDAGLRVLVVTGDHPRTAAAVAGEVGVRGPTLTGADVDRLDDEGLRRCARTAAVYARATPEHKLRLVRALQADDEVVAVTGDGVNDAPALRRAAVGVAMGQAGTATAKEAADIVLADDNFATLRAAIEEGRRVYDNLVKALTFVLPTSLGQALIIAIATLAFPLRGGEPQLPVEPVQILWINLIVAVALALPLALEAPEPDLMSRPPRDPRTTLLDRPLLVRTVLVSATLTAVALGLYAFEHQRQLDAGAGEALALARAQTTAVTGAVLLQALYLITCRSLTRPNRELGHFSNPAVFAGIALVLLLQALFVALPVAHDVFGSAELDLTALAVAMGAALVILPVTSLEERWRVRRATTPPVVCPWTRSGLDPDVRRPKGHDDVIEERKGAGR